MRNLMARIMIVPITVSQAFLEDAKKASSNLEACGLYGAQHVVAVTGLTIVAPLLALIGLVAAGVFALIGLFSAEEKAGDWYRDASITLNSVLYLVCSLHVLFVRIFYPCFQFEETDEDLDQWLTIMNAEPQVNQSYIIVPQHPL